MEKKTFKIGDTVRCVAGFTDDYGDDYGGAGYKEGYTFEIGEIKIGGNLGDACMPTNGGCGVFTHALELVTKDNQITYKVTREQLKEIYENVCNDWQSEIRGYLYADLFNGIIEVDKVVVEEAYKYATTDVQNEWLAKYLPKPKKLVTKEIVKYDAFYIGQKDFSSCSLYEMWDKKEDVQLTETYNTVAKITITYQIEE